MKNIAIIGGGPFGILSAVRLSQNKDNRITIFESKDKLGGLSGSEKYKGQYLDYTTKFIPCNQFGKPGINPSLESLLNKHGALLDDIGDYHFLLDGKKQDLPPIVSHVSKIQLVKEAINLYKKFPNLDAYARIVDMEKVNGFERDKTLTQQANDLGFPAFAQMIEYFSMIFGNSTIGVDSLTVLTSRNSYNTYNYLSNLFSKNVPLKALGKRIDKKNLLNRNTALPFKLLMLCSGYDNFLQALPKNIENITIRCNKAIKDIDKNENDKYTVISNSDGVFNDFDEVILALPMKHIKKMKYEYIHNLVKDIDTDMSNYILTSFCNLETNKLKFLPKGIYLDYRNPHKIGLEDAKKEGDCYGVFKHFHADSMFQSLTMVNDADRDAIDESFIHQKWDQFTQEMKWDVKPNQIKPYGWKVVEWNRPYAKIGDFKYLEKLEEVQGKEGIYFGGEIMAGPGIPMVLRYVEDMFGAFSRN